MKISFLSPFYPYRGGIAQFSDSLYLALQKHHEVKAFSFKRQYPGILFPGTSQYVLKNDVNKDMKAETVLDSLNPLTYRKTAKKIIHFNPDLVLISYWMPFFALSLGSVARFLKKRGYKVISILHNVIPHEGRIGDKLLTRFFLKQNDGYAVLNKFSEADLVKFIPHANYIVHPHPVYNHYGNKLELNEARQKLNIPLNKKVVLFFGLIRNYKGLDLLIEALIYLKMKDEYCLIIAGEPYGDFKKYQNIIDAHFLQNKIQLHLKYIPDKEVPLYFSAADVCVLPYKSATQSGITGIAYHFDLPVIVTDVGGLKDTVEDNKTGLIIPEPSAEHVGQALQRYFDEKLKTKFQSNIKNYKFSYSWDSLASAIVELYKKIKNE
ncbi:MAG: glycosyltransferase [Ignavibacteria bacterium]